MTDYIILGTIVEAHNCPTCGVVYTCPKGMMESQRKDGRGSHYCPNGHSLSFQTTENERLRRERDRLVQQQAQLQDEIAERDRLLTAERNKAKRAEKRAKAGVCPCCTRTFTNMSRHMKTKHPEFGAANVVKLSAAKA